MLRRCLRCISVLLAIVSTAIPVAAHHVENVAAPQTPGPTATAVALQGYVDQIVVENLVTGTSRRVPILAADDGHRLVLAGPGVDNLVNGNTVRVIGKQNGRALFPDSVQNIAARDSRHTLAQAAAASSFSGVLRLGHADNFDGTPSEYFMALDMGNGRLPRVELATTLGGLQNGMRVTIDGRLAATGELVPERIAIEGEAGKVLKAGPILQAPSTTNYLVIPIKFPNTDGTYGADPFTPATLNSAVFGAAGSVQAYYNEVSYGQQLLSGVVADNGSGGFLKSGVSAPSCSDFTAIGTAAENAAKARGYNVASYSAILYVFNNVPGCGWTGLAYVGFARAWSNNSTSLLVIAHELGHNFGLAHAASLDCGATSICSSGTSSEYGDPFDTMGNNRAMHFNSAQKSILNWLPAGSVSTHSSGTATYTLSPLETPGGSHYAVKVPVAANRTYWIEYRQPTGFDAGLSSFPNNGVQIRVASPFESICSGCYDDTEFLDMTPGTTSFTDGALVVGQSFTDPTYSIGISVLSATASALTVQVTAGGGTSTTTTLTSSLNPSTVGVSVTFTATVTGTAPTGTVNFTDGGASITGCTAVALSGSGNSRTATCVTSSLAAGTRSIVATYGGNAGNLASSSSALSQVVNSVVSATTTTLGSSANPSTAGANVTFTATVTGVGPTGTVNFKDGAASITGCSAVSLAGSGNTRTSACSTSALTTGTHSVTAVYGGKAGNLASTSSALSQVVNAGVSASTTAVASSANPSTAGANVTFTASVTGVAPTGTVNFKDGIASITGCSAVTLTGSGNTRTAACSTSAFTAGTHSVTGVYGGNAGNLTSTSAALSQVVKAVSTSTLASSANPSTTGANVTFTASVTGVAPTGTVNFKDGVASVTGCSAVALTGSGNTRTAACTTSALTTGTHSMTAAYGGDAGNVASTSSALSQVLNVNASIIPVTLGHTDFNGDRKTDIVFDNGGSKWLYTMNGATVQTTALLPGATAGWVLSGIGDFNGDGKADLLWRNTGDPTQFRIDLMNGTSIIGGGTVSATAGYLPTQIGDFDGDGKDDIVWENSAGGRLITFMNGASVVSTQPVPASAPGWVIARVGDFNGDGKADLLWRNTADPTQFWIYLMNGASVVGGGPVNVAAGYLPTQIGDFDGDGKDDILWENSAGGRWIYFMNGNTVVSGQPAPGAAAGWAIARVGDFNGDGKVDLLWQNTLSPNQFWIYLMNGVSVIGGGSLTVAPAYQPLAQ